MSNQFSKLLTGALVTGLLAGSVAFAEDNATNSTSNKQSQVSAEKNGCKGKSGSKEKNSCSGKEKEAMKKDKNACAGKDGCGQKHNDKAKHD